LTATAEHDSNKNNQFNTSVYDYYMQEEAQLSQRDCAMLRVTEYFAKSLEINQGHSKLHPCVSPY